MASWKVDIFVTLFTISPPLGPKHSHRLRDRGAGVVEAVAVLADVVLADADVRRFAAAAEAVGGREDVTPVDQRPAAEEVDASLGFIFLALKTKWFDQQRQFFVSESPSW